jgi:anti-sigma factor RsiW
VSGHVHDRLPLAAAGALDATEAARVEEHVGSCAACAARSAAWRALADALRGLPAPRPSANLAARTRAAVEAGLAERAERAWNRAAIAFAVAFAWTLAVGAWLLLDLVRGQLAVRLGTSIAPTAGWYAAYVLAGWTAAGAAAVLLGRRTASEGRVV